MGMEGGSRFESPHYRMDRITPEDPYGRGIEASLGYGVEGSPELTRADILIKFALSDTRTSDELFRVNPVVWLRGSIGLQTERGASQVSDRELMVRYAEGGKLEWDPELAKKVAAYLKSKGFNWTR